MFSRRYKFQIGDLVRHENSRQQGVVTEVRGSYVKFRVLEKTASDGTPYIAQFNIKKVALLATREQVLAWVMKEQAERKKKMRVSTRFANWVKRLFTPTPPTTGGAASAPARVS